MAADSGDEVPGDSGPNQIGLRLEWETPVSAIQARLGARALLEALGRIDEPLDLAFRVGSSSGRLHAGFVVGSFDNESALRAADVVHQLCLATMPWYGFTLVPIAELPELALPAYPAGASRLVEDNGTEEIRSDAGSPVARALVAIDAVVSATLVCTTISPVDASGIEGMFGDGAGAMGHRSGADIIVVARDSIPTVPAALLATELTGQPSAMRLENATGSPARDLVASHGLPHGSPPRLETLADIISLPTRATDQISWDALPTRPASPHDVTRALESAPDLHRLIVGRTGMGKSTLLLNLFEIAVTDGKAAVLVDIHGDLTERAIEIVKLHRPHDLRVLDTTGSRPGGFNPMIAERDQKRQEVLADLRAIVRVAWETAPDDFFGPVFWTTADFAFELVLLARARPTLDDVVHVLQGDTDKVNTLLSRAKRRHNEDGTALRAIERLASKWRNELQSFLTSRKDANNVWVNGKLHPFVADDHLRKVFCARENAVDLRSALIDSRIVIVRAPIGRLGELAINTIGATVMRRAFTASFSAYDGTSSVVPLAVFLDEWTKVAQTPVQEALAAGRKAGLELTLACQSLAQIRHPAVVLANVGTVASFRVGPVEARELAVEYGTVDERALRTLTPHVVAVRTPRGHELVARTPHPDRSSHPAPARISLERVAPATSSCTAATTGEQSTNRQETQATSRTTDTAR